MSWDGDRMARPHWLVAALAASLAGLLLAHDVLGQTFTYSRGWKPGGKRSHSPPPRPPSRLHSAAPGPPGDVPQPAQSSYPDDILVDDRQPVRYYVETLGERWAPYEVPPWRGQTHEDADDAEPYRTSELTTLGDHDDH